MIKERANVIDPLTYAEHKEFHAIIIEDFEVEYQKALDSGAFPDMHPGDHRIAIIVLGRVGQNFRPVSPEGKELARNYDNVCSRCKSTCAPSVSPLRRAGMAT